MIIFCKSWNLVPNDILISIPPIPICCLSRLQSHTSTCTAKRRKNIDRRRGILNIDPKAVNILVLIWWVLVSLKYLYFVVVFGQSNLQYGLHNLHFLFKKVSFNSYFVGALLFRIRKFIFPHENSDYSAMIKTDFLAFFKRLL